MSAEVKTAIGFIGPLVLQEYVVYNRSMEGQWVVEKDLMFVSKAGKVFIVPRGFITDLASIPKALRGLIDVNGKHRKAAVLHDYLYCMHSMKRSEADALFLEAMGGLEVGGPTRTAMWLGVRVGGWRYWNKRNSANDDVVDFVHESYFNAA